MFPASESRAMMSVKKPNTRYMRAIMYPTSFQHTFESTLHFIITMFASGVNAKSVTKMQTLVKFERFRFVSYFIVFSQTEQIHV